MAEIYKSFNDFLIKHRTTDKENITHTRIGNGDNILPGKYCIPDDKLDIFYKLYHRHVFVQEKSEYLTEKQNKTNNPILIDLDFRYDPSVKYRLHNEEYIEDLAVLYIEIIAKHIYNIDCSIPIPIYILEKDEPNTSNNEVTKDGIHIVIGIEMSHPAQEYLRKKMLENIGIVFGDLPITNDYSSVLDEGISKGHTNWQLYGSRKPAHEPYKLTKMLYITLKQDDSDDTDDINCDIEIIDLNEEDNEIKYNDLYLLKNLTARNKNLLKFELRPECKEYLDNHKKPTKTTKANNNNVKFIQQGFAFDVADITNIEILEKLLDALWDEITKDDYRIKETHEYLMSLPSKYCDEYQSWLQCGWALHNTDFRLFISWMYFSAKSAKFCFDDIPGYYEFWNNMKNEGFTGYSIMYWSKLENPKEYKKIREETVGYYVEQCGKSAAEWDVANVLFNIFKDEYRCADMSNKIWYRYQNNKWKKIDCGTSLRYSISQKLSRIFGEKAEELFNKTCNVDDPQKQEKYRKISSVYADISTDCKKTHYKQNIMKEAAEHFYKYDGEFYSKLDTNPNLLCCKNGVIDFENKEFREGLPDDYVSLCTNINYVPIDLNNANHVRITGEINDFMEQLFPDKALKKYMWEHLASVLIGKNVNQTFNIYNGSGSNGKSKLVDLMSCILGDYKGIVPITLVTSRRNGVGSLSPEIAALKGIRYAVMNEPSKGDVLNDGVMKELTGEDPINGRALYSPPVTFIPQFSIVVTTNTLFDIKSNDDGTWRRIRLCDFASKFVKEPFKDKRFSKELYPFQYSLNPKLSEKFEEWRELFLSMLVDTVFKTNGIVTDCENVLSASNDYRKNQDYFMEFKEERIAKSDSKDSKIRKTQVYKIFQEWYKETYGKQVPKGKELFEYLDNTIGKYKNGWVGYEIIFDDIVDVEDDDDEDH